MYRSMSIGSWAFSISPPTGSIILPALLRPKSHVFLLILRVDSQFDKRLGAVPDYLVLLCIKELAQACDDVVSNQVTAFVRGVIREWLFESFHEHVSMLSTDESDPPHGQERVPRCHEWCVCVRRM